MSSSSRTVSVTASPAAAPLEIFVYRDDTRDLRGLARWQHDHSVAGPHDAARDRAAIAAKILIGPIDPLNRHAERLRLRGRSTISTVSRCASSVGPSYQGIDTLGDVTLSPRSAEIGMQVTSADVDVGGKLAIRGADVVENHRVPVDGIHLVDGQHDVADAHQRHNVAVPEGLREQPLCARRPAARQARP